LARLTNIDLDVQVFRGDSATITLGLTRPDANGKPQAFPIATMTHEVWVTVKSNAGETDGEAVIRKKLSNPGDMVIRAAPNDWIVDVTIPAGETAFLDPGRYVYDAQVKVLASSEVRTMAVGRFEVLPDVTREF